MSCTYISDVVALAQAESSFMSSTENEAEPLDPNVSDFGVAQGTPVPMMRKASFLHLVV